MMVDVADKLEGGGSIAIFSHSHPFLSRGGGEIVAYNSFESYIEQGFDAFFYGAINVALRPTVKIFYSGESLIEYAPREMLFPAAGFDSFTHTHREISSFETIAESLVRRNVRYIHFHHFWNVGTDLIQYLRTRLPKAVFVLTLHELLAICYRDGQMIKTAGNALCYKSGEIDCHLCRPEITREQFRARRDYMKDFLESFDALISPSEFLASRFSGWGLNKDIYIVENGCDGYRAEETLPTSAETLTRRFAFFGQPTPYKGIDLFISAAATCLAEGRRDISFSIYGCDRLKFLEQFGASWSPILDALRGFLHFHGTYEPNRVLELMRHNGYIVVPSIWWENSPLVIQEAYVAGRPPIVADIGGMREKVTVGAGLHFRARDASSLSAVVKTAAGDVELWERLRAGRKLPHSVSEMNSMLLEIYAEADYNRSAT